MAINMSPGSSNGLQALNMLIQQQNQRKRSKEEIAMQLLGYRIRQDEAMKDRLFTEARETKKELASALDNYEKAQNEYIKMGGDLNEIMSGKDNPTVGIKKVMGSLSNMYGKDIKYAEKTIADAYGKMQNINSAFVDIENEIGSTQNFAAEVARKYFDRARLEDVNNPALKGTRRKDDLSSFYHKAYVTEDEANAMFDWMGTQGIQLNQAKRSALMDQWRTLSDKRYAQLMQEEGLRLEGIRAKGTKEWKPDLSDLRQTADSINLQYDSIDWDDGESRKVITPDAAAGNVTGVRRETMDAIAYTLERASDATKFWWDYDNIPDGITKETLEQFRTAKTPQARKKAASALADEIVKVDISQLDFSGRGGDEQDKQNYLVSLIDYYQKADAMQNVINTMRGAYSNVKPKEK